jgi:hypothetical protein
MTTDCIKIAVTKCAVQMINLLAVLIQGNIALQACYFH